MTEVATRRVGSRLAGRALATVIDAAAFAGSRLPAGVAHSLADAGGTIEWALRPGTRRRLAHNLGHVSGLDGRHARRLARRELINEARRSADLLWAIGNPAGVLASTEVDGAEHLTRAAAGGHGVVLASLHFGGWEVVSALPRTLLDVPTTAVVADDWLAWGIEHVRRANGLRVLYRGRAALAGVRLLRRGEALLVMGDDAVVGTTRTHLVQLCGQGVRLPAGCVALARIAQAPIVPFDVLPRGPRRWTVRIRPALAPPQADSGRAGEQRVLQQLADGWTTLLTAYPEHWAARFPIAWADATATRPRSRTS